MLLPAVPALATEYYSQPEARNCTALRTVQLGGEPLPCALVDLIYRSMPNVTVFNTYGETLSLWK